MKFKTRLFIIPLTGLKSLLLKNTKWDPFELAGVFISAVRISWSYKNRGWTSKSRSSFFCEPWMKSVLTWPAFHSWRQRVSPGLLSNSYSVPFLKGACAYTTESQSHFSKTRLPLLKFYHAVFTASLLIFFHQVYSDRHCFIFDMTRHSAALTTPPGWIMFLNYLHSSLPHTIEDWSSLRYING